MKLVNPPLFSGKHTILLVAVLALLGPGKLGAQTVVSNLSEGISGAGNTPVGRISTNLYQVVFSFTTGATAADFTGVSLTFAANGTSPGALSFGLYSTYSNGSGATNQLTTLTTSGNPLVTGTYSFTVPAGPVPLAAGTPYYLKLSADGSLGFANYYDVPKAATLNQTGLAGWTIGDSSYNFLNGSYNTTNAQAPLFSVQATEVGAVPEPSTYAVFVGLGVLGFATWRRRKSVSA